MDKKLLALTLLIIFFCVLIAIDMAFEEKHGRDEGRELFSIYLLVLGVPAAIASNIFFKIRYKRLQKSMKKLEKDCDTDGVE